MEEFVGKVKLDYSLYPGQDYYSDGDVEDELLQIVTDYSEEEYEGVIRDRKSWPITYHLSKKRQNIIEWIPFEKNMKVLEIGSGCGAITGTIAEQVDSVTCIELSKRRSLINANRNKHFDNVEIRVGNFKDIEPTITEKYDYITLIGVLEYAQLYIDSHNPFVDFLKIIRKHLKDNGKIVIAIENKFGLKYWSGCQEDHMDKFFVGVEGYREGDAVKTFTKKELEKMFKDAGFLGGKFYYPYPDYKFPESIYSDEYLPKTGELSNNIKNMDKTRMVTFDETKVFDGLINEGLFTEFSNSYMVMLQKENI